MQHRKCVGLAEKRGEAMDCTQEAKCSRFCHDRYCPHWKDSTQSVKSGSFYDLAQQAYDTNILWLRHNGLGLSYAEMNILVYLILFPILSLLLLWGLIRKRHGQTA
ncbi:MAG: hypothetical protein AAF206_18360 [Bacteroidota bacterium]